MRALIQATNKQGGQTGVETEEKEKCTVSG